jgi:hypothetical protein
MTWRATSAWGPPAGGVAVGVPLERSLAVRRLDLALGRAAGHAQDQVWVHLFISRVWRTKPNQPTMCSCALGAAGLCLQLQLSCSSRLRAPVHYLQQPTMCTGAVGLGYQRQASGRLVGDAMALAFFSLFSF